MLPGLRLYLIPLSCLLLTWAVAMSIVGAWPLFLQHWPMSLTMVVGSFVAGSTPAGGASVAFPVFTKVLHIESHQAATFGLLIQAVGMTMASLFILARRIPFYGSIYRQGALGGSLGVLAGLAWLHVPSPLPKILFSCLVLTFALALAITRRDRSPKRPPHFTATDHRRFFLTGILGGLLASQTGSGVDMLLFIVMIMAHHLDEKRAIPTSILIMATVSLTGVAGLLLIPGRPIGVVWEFWAVCVPIVALGAPLGAYVVSKVSSRVITSAVTILIGIEVLSTYLVIPMTPDRLEFASGILVLAGLGQWHLHRVSLTKTL